MPYVRREDVDERLWCDYIKTIEHIKNYVVERRRIKGQCIDYLKAKQAFIKETREAYIRCETERVVIMTKILERLSVDLSHRLDVRDRIIMIINSYTRVVVNSRTSDDSAPPSITCLLNCICSHVNFCAVNHKFHSLHDFLKTHIDKLSPILTEMSVRRKHACLTHEEAMKKYNDKVTRRFTTSEFTRLREIRDNWCRPWLDESACACPMLAHRRRRHSIVQDDEDDYCFAIDLYFDGTTSPTETRRMDLNRCVLCEFMQRLMQV